MTRKQFFKKISVLGVSAAIMGVDLVRGKDNNDVVTHKYVAEYLLPRISLSRNEIATYVVNTKDGLYCCLACDTKHLKGITSHVKNLENRIGKVSPREIIISEFDLERRSERMTKLVIVLDPKTSSKKIRTGVTEVISYKDYFNV